MEFKLPKEMTDRGVHFASEEEWKEMDKIDPNFCYESDETETDSDDEEE